MLFVNKINEIEENILIHTYYYSCDGYYYFFKITK